MNKSNPRLQKVIARVEEYNYLVEMEAEGQSEKFLSETETDEERRQGKVHNSADLRIKEVDVDSEITFRLQTNNNASIIHTENEETEDDLETEDGEYVTPQNWSGKTNEFGKEIILIGQNNRQTTPGSMEIRTANDMLLEEGTMDDSQPGSSGYNPRGHSEQVEVAQDYIDQRIQSSISKVQNFFEKKFEDLSHVRELEKQLEENKRQLEQLRAKGTGELREALPRVDDGQSEITVYCNVVQKQRDSSSSDELDMSDELLMAGMIISEKELMTKEKTDKAGKAGQETVPDGSQPPSDGKRTPQKKETAESRAERLLLDAKKARARLYDATGNENGPVEINQATRCDGRSSSLMDEDYLLVASHVDVKTRLKISKGEYIDFSKLVRKDKVIDEEEQKMIMVNKGGMFYSVPMSDRSQTITSYAKWDSAFRVFLDIYTSYHPNCTSELIQYGHIIHTASLSYAWDNVYLYDLEFRRHIERHPSRSWGVILQQAWTMFLKDRNNYTPNNRGHGVHNTQNQSGRNSTVSKRLCFDFNQGNCTYGSRCKFEHKCSFCLKYGHGAWNCHRATAKNGQSSSTNGAANNNVNQTDHGNCQQVNKKE